jgi:hypothetical protein
MSRLLLAGVLHHFAFGTDVFHLLVADLARPAQCRLKTQCGFFGRETLLIFVCHISAYGRNPVSDDHRRPIIGRFTTANSGEFDPYYHALEVVATAWAEFEFNVNDVIWELANIERMAGTCMTSQMIGPGPRFRCLVALLRLRNAPKELIDMMNSLSGEAEKQGRQRNRYLHDPMVLNTADNSIHRMETTADRKVTHGAIPVEIKEIETLTNGIRSLDAKFDGLYLRILAETPPWPRTQFSQSRGIQRDRPGRESDSSIPELPPES